MSLLVPIPTHVPTCSLVFTTSSGQVIVVPAAPAMLNDVTSVMQSVVVHL